MHAKELQVDKKLSSHKNHATIIYLYIKEESTAGSH